MDGKGLEPLQWSIFSLEGGTDGNPEAGEPPMVLVLSREIANRALPVVTVIPLNGLKPDRRVYPNEARLPSGATALGHAAVLMAHQIRTLPKNRLSTRLARIDDPGLRSAVRSAVRVQLDLEDSAGDQSEAKTAMGE